MGLAAPVNGAGDGEVKPPVGGGELTRGVAEAAGFAAAAGFATAAAAAISAAARGREEDVGGFDGTY